MSEALSPSNFDLGDGKKHVVFDELIYDTCRQIFEEDWRYFCERPTLIDAIQNIVAKALWQASTDHHITLSGEGERR